MTSLPPAYFDDLYADAPDPWDFATSPYEAAKYAATLAALPQPRYRAALEIGCSIGVLTGSLAERCDSVLAIDVARVALDQARKRNAALPHIRFETGQFPAAMPTDMPAAGFDLIMLSEVLYYLDAAALADAARATLALARPSADILLVHWLGPTPGYPMTGDGAAEAFLGAVQPGAGVVMQKREPQYRIDLLRRQASP